MRQSKHPLVERDLVGIVEHIVEVTQGDFDAAVTWLKSRNIVFQTEPWESPACRMATVFDPDGNCLAIHKVKTAAQTPA